MEHSLSIAAVKNREITRGERISGELWKARHDPRVRLKRLAAACCDWVFSSLRFGLVWVRLLSSLERLLRLLASGAPGSRA